MNGSTGPSRCYDRVPAEHRTDLTENHELRRDRVLAEADRLNGGAVMRAYFTFLLNSEDYSDFNAIQFERWLLGVLRRIPSTKTLHPDGVDVPAGVPDKGPLSQLDLGLVAMQIEGFTLSSGMLVGGIAGFRRVPDGVEARVAFELDARQKREATVPWFRDPATLGCLLDQVRKTLCAPGLSPRFVVEWTEGVESRLWYMYTPGDTGQTLSEVECLLAVLALHPPQGSDEDAGESLAQILGAL